jgi:hypothetical protein
VFIVAFPLLIIPLAIYNMIAFLTPPDSGWNSKVVTIRLVSGVDWTITFSDALIVLALLLLMFEFIKAARPGAKSVIDHLLSALVFIGAAAEFIMVKQAATSPYAILGVMCLVDFVGGIAVSVRVSRRVRNAEKVEAPRHVSEPAHFLPEVSPLSRETPPSSHAASSHPSDPSHPTP